MDYTYKVVPFIGRSRGDLSAAEVAQQLEAVINEHAAKGWEFHQLSDVNIEVQPGCIAGLFGAKVQYARFDQLIFRTERTTERYATQKESRGVERHAARTETSPAAVPERKRDDRAGHDDQPAALKQRSRTRPPLPPAQRHLEIWREKSDDELLQAAASLDDYTVEASAVIRAELAWRNLTAEGEDTNGVAAGSFCYHCGADVPVGAQACSACGKTL